MCEDAVEETTNLLHFPPDHLKTREMCAEAVKEDPWALQYVPDWSVTQEQEKIWLDDFDLDDDDELITWCNEYEQCKAQKAEIIEGLMSIAYHLPRWWD